MTLTGRTEAHMRLPLVSRARHEELKAAYERMVAALAAQLEELKAERRILWDKICLLGIGAPMFGALPEEPVAEEKTDKKQVERPAPLPQRPSAIMRRMDRLAEGRWLRKLHPAANNKPLMDQLDEIDRQTVQQAGGR